MFSKGWVSHRMKNVRLGLYSDKEHNQPVQTAGHLRGTGDGGRSTPLLSTPTWDTILCRHVRRQVSPEEWYGWRNRTGVRTAGWETQSSTPQGPQGRIGQFHRKQHHETTELFLFLLGNRASKPSTTCFQDEASIPAKHQKESFPRPTIHILSTAITL